MATQFPPDYLANAVGVMGDCGIQFAPGLTASQVQAAEVAHGFNFPPDLRAFLEFALPVGERIPDWREPTSKSVLHALAWPADSLCFDIEHNGFWLASWGPKPEKLEGAFALARDAVRAAPFLVPIYAHRYIPAAPCEAGNPVFSVYQTDIIYYGLDLASYLFAEFSVPNPFPMPESPRAIEFWGELERRNS